MTNGPTNVPTIPENLRTKYDDVQGWARRATEEQNRFYLENSGIAFNEIDSDDFIEIFILEKGFQPTHTHRVLSLKRSYLETHRKLAIRMRKQIQGYSQPGKPVFINVVYVMAYIDGKTEARIPVYIFQFNDHFEKYIDLDARIYNSWNDFLKTNIIDPSLCCYPIDGHYGQHQKTEIPTFDQSILPKLAINEPPSCELGKTILRGIKSAFEYGGYYLMASSVINRSAATKIFDKCPRLLKAVDFLEKNQKRFQQANAIFTTVNSIMDISDKISHEDLQIAADVNIIVVSVLTLTSDSINKKLVQKGLGEKDLETATFEDLSPKIKFFLNTFSTARCITSISSVITVIVTMAYKEKCSPSDYFNLASSLYAGYGVFTSPLKAEKIFKQIQEEHLNSLIGNEIQKENKFQKENEIQNEGEIKKKFNVEIPIGIGIHDVINSSKQSDAQYYSYSYSEHSKEQPKTQQNKKEGGNPNDQPKSDQSKNERENSKEQPKEAQNENEGTRGCKSDSFFEKNKTEKAPEEDNFMKNRTLKNDQQNTDQKPETKTNENGDFSIEKASGTCLKKTATSEGKNIDQSNNKKESDSIVDPATKNLYCFNKETFPTDSKVGLRKELEKPCTIEEQKAFITKSAKNIIRNENDVAGISASNNLIDLIMNHGENNNTYVKNGQIIRLIVACDDLRELCCEIAFTETKFDIKNGILLVNGQLNIDGGALAAELNKTGNKSNFAQQLLDKIEGNNTNNCDNTHRIMRNTKQYDNELAKLDEELNKKIANIETIAIQELEFEKDSQLSADIEMRKQNRLQKARHDYEIEKNKLEESLTVLKKNDRLVYEIDINEFDQLIEAENLSNFQIDNKSIFKNLTIPDYHRLIEQVYKAEYDYICISIRASVTLAKILKFADVKGIAACHAIILKESQWYAKERTEQLDETQTKLIIEFFFFFGFSYFINSSDTYCEEMAKDVREAVNQIEKFLESGQFEDIIHPKIDFSNKNPHITAVMAYSQANYCEDLKNLREMQLSKKISNTKALIYMSSEQNLDETGKKDKTFSASELELLILKYIQEGSTLDSLFQYLGDIGKGPKLFVKNIFEDELFKSVKCGMMHTTTVLVTQGNTRFIEEARKNISLDSVVFETWKKKLLKNNIQMNDERVIVLNDSLQKFYFLLESRFLPDEPVQILKNFIIEWLESGEMLPETWDIWNTWFSDGLHLKTLKNVKWPSSENVVMKSKLSTAMEAYPADDFLGKDDLKKLLKLYFEKPEIEVHVVEHTDANGKRTTTETKILNVVGVSIFLSKDKPHIEEMLRKKDIEQVDIIALNAFYIDVDIVEELWSGKNISVVTKKIIVCDKRVITVSGKDAPKYEKPKVNVYDGINGSCGKDGTDGKDGKDGKPGESSGNIIMLAEDIKNSRNLTCNLNGGNGQDGEDGGKGGDGYNGKGITLSEFKNVLTMDQIIDQAIWRVKNGEKPYESTDSEGRQHYYCIGIDCRWLLFNNYESVFWVKGTDGTAGGVGGRNGKGGQGGSPGECNISNSLTGNEYQVTKNQNNGVDGRSGDVGESGFSGSNGNDIARITRSNASHIFFDNNNTHYYGDQSPKRLKIEYYFDRGFFRRINEYRKNVQNYQRCFAEFAECDIPAGGLQKQKTAEKKERSTEAQTTMKNGYLA